MESKTNHEKLVQIEIFNGSHLENIQINHVPGVIWPGFFSETQRDQLKQLKQKNDLLEFLGGSSIYWPD